MLFLVRQRYWGEPFPVYYDADGMPQMIADGAPALGYACQKWKSTCPTETGEPPLGNATHWAWNTESNTVVANELIDQQHHGFPIGIEHHAWLGRAVPSILTATWIHRMTEAIYSK